MTDREVARGLGWASILIGLSEIATPRRLEQMLGISNGQNTGILRVLGVREILTGVDILSHRDPTPGVWARVVGDALDGTLMAAAGRKTRNPSGFTKALMMVLGITALDVIFAGRLARDYRYQRLA